MIPGEHGAAGFRGIFESAFDEQKSPLLAIRQREFFAAGTCLNLCIQLEKRDLAIGDVALERRVLQGPTRPQSQSEHCCAESEQRPARGQCRKARDLAYLGVPQDGLR